MLGVQWYEAKEGGREGVREVNGDMNPLRSQRVLVVCWVVARGVVLVEEVGWGHRVLLWKGTRPDPRASPCVSSLGERTGWKPTSTQRQNHRNLNHYPPPPPSRYSMASTIYNPPKRSNPTHTARSLRPPYSSFIQCLAGCCCFPKFNLGTSAIFFASFAPVVDPVKRSLNAFPPPPASPPPRVDTADPERCTPNVEGMDLPERGTWHKGEGGEPVVREVSKQIGFSVCQL
jgi:hypothetical protein